MQFYFTIWNHHPNAHDLLQDVVLPITAGLRDLGHEVEIGAEPPRRGVTNIVIEYFRDPWIFERFKGLDYVLIGTELADGAGFNHKRTKTWIKRWHGFLELAKEARAVWVVCDDGLSGYPVLAPTVQISLGWSPSLVTPPSSGQRDFDIYAFGKLTSPIRRATLERLGTRLRVTSTEMSTLALRNQLLQRSLFSYGFRPYQPVGFASTSRIVSSLMQSVPVLQERVERPSPLSDAMEIIDGADDVIDRWEDLKARRSEMLQRQLAAWMSMPSAKIMEPAVAAMLPSRDTGPLYCPPLSLLERSTLLRSVVRRVSRSI